MYNDKTSVIDDLKSTDHTTITNKKSK